MNLIKQLRKENNFTQAKLADKVGVSRSTVAMWETDTCKPDSDMLVSLASLFHVTTDYLLGREEATDAPSGKGIRIPVLGSVRAGVPIEAVEDILDYEEITPELSVSGKFFALKVRGDSMEPRISDGDVVIVRQQEDAETGDTVVALINGDEATVKRLKKRPEGLMLIPNNPAYEPMFFTQAEILSLPVRIVGKVIELRRTF